MKTFALSLTVLALLALLVGPAAADPRPLLVADLDNDGDLEHVFIRFRPDPWPEEQLFSTTDVDNDGDPDQIETRGKPKLLCNLDNDRLPEAVIQDDALIDAWHADRIGPAPTKYAWSLVFVRGQVEGCYQPGPAIGDLLLVYEPPLTGAVCIDGDGRPEIAWIDWPGDGAEW
jgi:hypothetical protein